mmetsp:Transcript_12197/g.31261  ORF Transcript_12197/g.31261 Transcript_12197/m.31261 type:complete len:216 (+) Transcript_12197:288-935(+)
MPSRRQECHLPAVPPTTAPSTPHSTPRPSWTSRQRPEAGSTKPSSSAWGGCASALLTTAGCSTSEITGSMLGLCGTQHLECRLRTWHSSPRRRTHCRVTNRVPRCSPPAKDRHFLASLIDESLRVLSLHCALRTATPTVFLATLAALVGHKSVHLLLRECAVSRRGTKPGIPTRRKWGLRRARWGRWTSSAPRRRCCCTGRSARADSAPCRRSGR